MGNAPGCTDGSPAVSRKSDAQREQRDRADAHDQDHKGDRVVVEPMSTLYAHDAPRPERSIRGHSCPKCPIGRLVTCVSISRVLASKGSNLRPSGRGLFLLRYRFKISPYIVEFKAYFSTFHCIDQPWLTTSDCPVSALVSKPAKNTAVSATSASVVNSPSTVSFSMTFLMTSASEMPSSLACSGICLSTSGVRTKPGQMTFARTPCLAPSFATTLASPISPCLAVT